MKKMVMVKCNRCGNKFKEKFLVWLDVKTEFNPSIKFICPKCYSKYYKEVNN